uniref:NADH-ubiquinone oxidoreductase chain 4 n=1 Tax=Tetranychus cinnabarinus TaxID=93129 RepID=E0AE51_TETCI|nr:NADH dehydrogenase subunit 4 [Tetranychus cinnabarinus]ADK89670.1 NADH dehydrogenase subunit 4 [Tetranychus cinnabarinus]
MSFMYLFFFTNNVILTFMIMFLYLIFFENFINCMMMFMTMIMMKMTLFSMKEKMNNYFFFMKKKMIMMLMIMLLMFFYTKKMINFYIYFELISLMIFSLIFFSSFSNQRLKASIYIFMFMGMSTFPMLTMFFFLNENTMLLIFFLGFLIKIPMVFFHLWLPKAHVEANFYDSMILASLLLKLGGYGVMLLNLNKKMNFFFMWTLMSIFFLSISMIFLMDLKMIFAYSSIIHMNSMVMMLLSNNFFTEKMFVQMMISHAISSSMMFYIIGMIYEYTFSRMMMINKSFLINNLILFMIIFFILFINMSMPPFMTFFSEMYMYLSLINYSSKMMIILIYILLVSIMFNLVVMKNMGMSNMNKFFKINQMKTKNLFLVNEHFTFILFM